MPKEKRGGSSMAQKGKSIAEQYMVRRTRKHSKRENKRKRHQENVQNPKRSVVEYWNSKSRYV